jgi:hypothetical protein
MKKILLVCLVSVGLNSLATAGDWFDMEKCEICKPMAEHMHMMGDVKWETHMLPNGFLSISVIPPEHKEMMDKAHDEMEAQIKRAMNGEEMELCGHCQSWGKLMDAGAHREELDTVGGMITIVTADDAEAVKKIQAHAQKSMDEFKKMMQAAPAS